MENISNYDLMQTLRFMAWERAKGELQGVLNTYWSGQPTDESYDKARDKINSFIKEIDDDGLLD